MRFALTYTMLITAALMLTSSTNEAAACSCAGGLRTFPEDGASDAPLNVKPALFQRWALLPGTSFALRVAGQRARVQTLETVRTRERHGDTLVVLEPLESLLPMTSYELVQGPFVVSTFRTGRRRDGEAPGLASLQSLSVETMDTEEQGNSCIGGYEGIFGRLRVEYPAFPKDAAYYLMQMHSEAGNFWNDDWILVSKAWELRPLSIADRTCNPRPPILRPGQRYCASLVAVDLAGNRSDSTQELCVTAAACRFDPVEDGEPTELCTEISGGEDEEPQAGGCSVVNTSTPGAAWLLLGLWALCRRRRGQARAGNSVLSQQSKPTTEAELLKQAAKEGCDYAFVVALLDDPSVTGIDREDRMAMIMALRGSDSVSPPPLVMYKIEKGGKRKRVRGAMFGSIRLRAWRDLIAGKKAAVHSFGVSTDDSPFGMLAGRGGDPASIIAPELLFPEVEVKPAGSGSPPAISSPLTSD